jgi:nucleoside 2-deoxyribosyltransferase
MGEFKDLIKVIYLSGPMDHLTTENNNPALSMSIWRDKAEAYFNRYKVDVINPIRVPTDINARWIVRGDKMSIKKSDAILVNFSQVGKPGVNGEIVMACGTIMEIHFAYQLGKPVVVYDTGREYDELSVWLRYHSTILCKTQLEAMQWLVSLNDKKLRHIDFRQDDSTIEGFDK